MNLRAQRADWRVSAAASCALILLAFTCEAATERQWRFQVYLDDQPVGHHHFTLERRGDTQHLTSEAEFVVRFLKLPLYRYQHASQERWYHGCLERISANTDQNGNLFRVEGAAGDRGFSIRSGDDEVTLPPCISTFAYWDRNFLANNRLLNPQTGEYLDVQVEDLGEHLLETGDSQLPAHHYRLHAGELEIEVWYSRDDRWLALQSTTGSGAVLRYVAE